MSLTEKQKTIIIETWKSMKEARNTWPDLLIRLFAKHTEYQKLFKAFANVPLEQLKDDERLMKQVVDIVSAISLCIDSMDDENSLVENMKGMATRHYHRKVTIEMFENLGIVFVGWLVDNLGCETMNDEAINAWSRLYTTLVSIVKNYYETIDNRNTNY